MNYSKGNIGSPLPLPWGLGERNEPICNTINMSLINSILKKELRE